MAPAVHRLDLQWEVSALIQMRVAVKIILKTEWQSLKKKSYTIEGDKKRLEH